MVVTAAAVGCGWSLAVERRSPDVLPPPPSLTPLLLPLEVVMAMLLERVVGAVVVSGKLLLPVISVLSCTLALSRNRSRLASERSLLDS